MTLLVVLALLGAMLFASPVAYDAHRVGDLPGLKQTDVPFSHFAGQLHLSTPTEEKLFYWYAQSRRSPESDPIVLWLNGGPGCASSEGFFTENGPFVAKRDGTVGLNPYGWNARANIVWVDSPSGVGFSQPLQAASGYYNDDVVADRLRLFLLHVYGSQLHFALRRAVLKAHEAADTGEFNHYYIYGDVCHLKNKQRGALHSHLLDKVDPKIQMHRGVVGPCAGDFTDALLNRLDVQEALHIEGELPVKWVDCQPYISHNFDRTFSSLNKYRKLLGNDLKVLIYSGDADSVVNFIGTQRWITEDDGLALKPASPWRAWLGPDDQIAGYHQRFELGLTFKTVKGAGHMVPAVRPLHGLHLFDCFIFGDDKCTAITYPTDPFEREAAGGAFGPASKKDDDDEHHDAVLAQQTSATVSQANATAEAASGATVSLFIGCAFLILATTVYAHRRRRQNGHRRQQYHPI
ncbi:Serine carboxypeptidase [Phytophthora infestans]|uniref:Serine carboxypeptidase n=1 Tax=Phytophthora infestans TaxID=4787 RepID=A0A833WAF4_PHYIN|nr:Serine carboxypeptidase [Phytophthora infestans]